MGLCESGNCPEVVLSSDIQFDGTFATITVPAGADLNDVLFLMEEYFNNTLLDLENDTYVLAAGNCIGLAAGSYGYQQLLTAVITKLCEIANSVTNTTDTDNVNLINLTYPGCFSAFTGTTLTELLDLIMSKLCTIIGKYIALNAEVNSLIEDYNAPIWLFKDVLSGLLDVDTFVYDHTTPTMVANTLSVTVKPMKAVVISYPINRPVDEIFPLTGNKDIYFTLDDKGVVAKIEQTIGDPVPAMVNKAYMYKIVTDGTGIISYTAQFATSGFTAPALSIPDSTITNGMIITNAITSSKLQTLVTADTQGDPKVFELTYNNKGQVTACVSNIKLTGVTDGQIFVYSSAQGGFVNVDNLSVGTAGYLPVASGGDFIASSVQEDAQFLTMGKLVEINDGVPQALGECALNVVNGTFITHRVTAATASLYALNNGTLIYLTTTNGTFTSVGFWGCENGVWVKL